MAKRIEVKVAQKEYVVRKSNPFLFWRPAQIVELLTHDLETLYAFDTDAVPADIEKQFAWGLEFDDAKEFKSIWTLSVVSLLNQVGAKFEISTQRKNIKRVFIIERIC